MKNKKIIFGITCIFLILILCLLSLSVSAVTSETYVGIISSDYDEHYDSYGDKVYYVQPVFLVKKTDYPKEREILTSGTVCLEEELGPVSIINLWVFSILVASQTS